MVLSRQCDWRWIPGFAYHEDEEERLRRLAIRMPRKVVAIWLMASAVIFLLLCLAALSLIAGLAFAIVWRRPGDISPLGSVAAMGMVLILAFAVGAPLAVLFAGEVAERFERLSNAAPERSIDVRLFYRVRGQLRRAGAVFALVFVAAAVLWLASLG